MPEVGEIKTNPNNPAQKARWDGAQWVDASGGQAAAGIPVGATARPDYGDGVYQSTDGAILARGSKGGLQMLQGAQMATGDAKTRINLAIDPSVASQEQMARSERRGSSSPINPLNNDWGAALLVGRDDEGKALDAIGKAWGGQDFQDYQQASKTFESSVIPIFSGAAVTTSEASRFIKANLPELGDTPQTLATKARNRAMILNSAATLTGKPKPFPEVPTWQAARLGVAPTGAPASQPRPREPGPGQSRITPQGLTPAQRRAAAAFRGTASGSGTAGNPSIPANEAQYRALPKGVHYIGPDGQIRVKQ